MAKRAAAEGLLRDVLDTIPDAVAAYDKDDVLVLFNQAYKDFYSLSAPTIRVGARFEDILRFGIENGQYVDAGETPEARAAWLARRLEMHRERPTERVIQPLGDGQWLQVRERRSASGYTVGVRTDHQPSAEAEPRPAIKRQRRSRDAAHRASANSRAVVNPAPRPRAGSRGCAVPPGVRRGGAARSRPSQRTSTTRSATTPATRCCARWLGGCRPTCASSDVVARARRRRVSPSSCPPSRTGREDAHAIVAGLGTRACAGRSVISGREFRPSGSKSASTLFGPHERRYYIVRPEPLVQETPTSRSTRPRRAGATPGASFRSGAAQSSRADAREISRTTCADAIAASQLDGRAPAPGAHPRRGAYRLRALVRWRRKPRLALAGRVLCRSPRE